MDNVASTHLPLTEGIGGQATHAKHMFELGRWQIFGKARNGQTRGWFTCQDDEFEPVRADRMHLSLVRSMNRRIELNVAITVTFKAAHLWEFCVLA